MDYTLYNAPELFRPFIKMLGNMLYDISGKNTIKDITSALETTASWDNGQTLIENACDFLAPLSVGFLIFYFLFELLDRATKGEAMSYEMFFKSFLKLIVGFFLISNCATLINFVLSFGESFFDLVKNYFQDQNPEDVEDYKYQLYDSIANYIIQRKGILKFGTESTNPEVIIQNLWQTACAMMSWIWQILGSLCLLVFPWLCSKAIYVTTIIVSGVRLFEITIRGIFAPLAISQSAFSNSNPWGKRYLKQYLALAIQGAFILGVGMLSGVVSGAATMSTDTLATLIDAKAFLSMNLTLLTTLAFRIAGTALIIKSKDLCEEIVGV